MSRPQRFSIKQEYWTTPEEVEALDRLTASGLLTRADHHRAAMHWYLIQSGALASPQPRANGQSHQEGHHGL